MGDATVAEVKAEFEKRVQAGEFIETSNRAPGRAFTTSEMIDHEHNTIHAMRAGQNQHQPIARFETRRDIVQDHSHLSESQRMAVEQILSSRDQVTALEGVAGAGKTTSLVAIREAAEREGYKAEGFAPTSRAAQKLGEARIESNTLQRHLTRSEEPHDGQKRLYVLDESSLASTKQMYEFLHRLRENDRVQFTAPDRERHIANRELAIVEKLDANGNLQLCLDSGRAVEFNIRQNPHLDYGYAVTSHSSQGQTADRVLVHVDTEQAGEKLVNQRLAYVAISRGRYDAQVYTNDKSQLAEGLSRDVSHRSAMEPNRQSVSAHEIGRSSTSSQAHEHIQAEGHSMSR
jgi:ATP-dependent exoDNAse (exonuclease V) alpha subunit